jgi:hypothetical protein
VKEDMPEDVRGKNRKDKKREERREGVMRRERRNIGEGER